MVRRRAGRAAQRLRWLLKGTDEGASHPFGITKAGCLRNALNTTCRGLHHRTRRFDPQPLHGFGWRGSDLGDEGARKMPRAHRDPRSKFLNGEPLMKMRTHPIEQRAEPASRRLQLQL